jgi:phosphatidylglycerophosphate synthase
MREHKSYTVAECNSSLLFEYVTHPIYCQIVKLVPRGVHPNELTLLGLFCSTLSSALALSFFTRAAMPTADAHPTDWQPNYASLILIGALCLIYTICDNIDGKHARATGQTSLLGEYLDHGGDCVTSLMSTVVLALSLGASYRQAGMAVMIVASNTAIAHAIHFYTGVLIMGNRYVSVEEAMVAFGVVPILRGLFPAMASAEVYGNKVSQLIFTFFLLSQASMLFGLLRTYAAAVKEISVIVVLAFNGLAYYVPAHAVLAANTYTVFGADVPYMVLWVLFVTWSNSSLIHIGIYSRCVHSHEMENWPVAVVVVSACVFLASPLYGAALAVASHAAQILYHCYQIRQKDLSINKKQA